jgi:uncharacterized protein (UPF0548 family)
MIILHKPNTDEICRLLAKWQDSPLSYEPPPRRGFIADEHAARLGSGTTAYQAACAALDRWHMFPAWTAVCGKEGQETGRVVAMVVRICGLWWVNPCRILRRCDSETTHGFVYGTLPQHAECGEEQFIIEKRPDDSVWYVIRAFSRPQHCLAWLAFPLARWWQCRFVRDSQRRMQHE